MKTKLALLALVLAVVISAIARCGEQDVLLQAGLDLLAKGKTESAEHLFYTVLVKEPDNGIALHEAGKLLLKNGDTATGYDFLRRAIGALEKTSNMARVADCRAKLSGAGAPALALKSALDEYRGSLERIVNSGNTVITREAALERARALGLELKITARDMTFAAYAIVELKQSLTTPVVTLAEGSSRVMNFAQPYTNVPPALCGLKYQQVRNGEAQQPVLKAIQGGKVFVACSEDTAKRIKAVATGQQLSAGGETVNVYSLTLTAGQVVMFKDQAIVLAAEVTIVTK